jgi:hypothetical protein
MPLRRSRPWRPDSHRIASGEPGTVQTDHGENHEPGGADQRICLTKVIEKLPGHDRAPLRDRLSRILAYAPWFILAAASHATFRPKRLAVQSRSDGASAGAPRLGAPLV